MAPVEFTVHHHFDHSAQEVWDELVDWTGHANWIPATRVELGPGDPLAIGAEFTAWTGFGPLTLKDHMRVAAISWDAERQHGTCTVDKLGPVLQGTARLTVSASDPTADAGADVEWVEDVQVLRLPAMLGPVAAKVGALGFKLGMKNLGRQMHKR